MSKTSLLPVTILTGFLGSGKTTLINHLLQHHEQERIAIVENEFGEVGVDGSLLRGFANVDVIELSNGCVCCSVRGELTAALTELIAQREAGQVMIDRLILETTGLADPAPIVQTFFVDETIRNKIVLDAVVTLVDCEHALKQLDEHRVAASQVGFADRIILTKIDRVDEAQKQRVLTRLHQINQKVQVYEAVNGVLPKASWLDIHAFDLDSGLQIRHGSYVAQATDPKQVQFVRFTPVSQSWNDDIHSYVFRAGNLDIGLIGKFMENLVEQHGNDMLRYKGVLAIEGNPQKLIVQGVHKVVGFDFGDEWQVGEERQSLIVVIGRRIPYDELNAAFLTTIAGDS